MLFQKESCWIFYLFIFHNNIEVDLHDPWAEVAAASRALVKQWKALVLEVQVIQHKVGLSPDYFMRLGFRV